MKAQCDGTINMLNPIKVGDFVQGRTEIASIIPVNNENYKVEVYIDNQSFGEIKEGDDVTLEFGSLPQREYGIVK
ncbi:HlyD family efflux transporter periplasmic adaptor subunit [Clostridium gasigenes]|uniref:HlyD family efflux transporter periplasmic adaptor subunit n=1 Tax=Clostridium gasigenes TaxID=94869 RepID=UPI003399F501